MPVYHQNTFTLITERVAPVTDEPVRPMTSKQVKKAHKAANKGPKLSRGEQRKIELAEQERIRKELEKDRQANRARLAREKKKSKEDQEKQERRRNGRPLVDVRPSQNLIARFVRGNGWGKKKEAGESETPQLVPVAEADEPTDEHESETKPQNTETRATEVPEPKPAIIPDASVTEEDPGTVSESQRFHPNTYQESPNSVEKGTPQPDASRPATGLLMVPSNQTGREEHIEEDRPANSKPAIAAHASQAFWDDELDDDLMQQLGVTQKPVVSSKSEGDGSGKATDYKPSQNPSQNPSQARASQAASKSCPSPSVGAKENHIDSLDNVLAGIGTQAVGLWEEEELEFMASQQPMPSFQQPKQTTTMPSTDRISTKGTAEDDESPGATEALFDQYAPPSPVLQQDKEENYTSNNRSQHQKGDARPRANGLRRQLSRQLSGFTEDGLDDEALQQLEIGTQPDEGPTTDPGNPEQSKQHPMAAPPNPPVVSRRPASHPIDISPDESMAPPPVPQPPPMSTQAVLSNFDDYFPSPSQQERELDDGFGDILKSQPTPCPPPKRPRSQQLQPPRASPAHSLKSQKRFFSASGSNEQLSLAMHRSKRDAAMQELHQKERQRVEAGRAQAKQARQARQHGRQFLAQPSTALRPVNNQTRAPRPAGQPPVWITNETIGPPPKRQKTARTGSQARPPVFKQPTTKPTGLHKPPAFKQSIQTTTQAAEDKENCRQAPAAPSTSQGSDYGGDWIDDMAKDMASSGRGCLSATQMVSDRSSDRFIR